MDARDAERLPDGFDFLICPDLIELSVTGGSQHTSRRSRTISHTRESLFTREMAEFLTVEDAYTQRATFTDGEEEEDTKGGSPGRSVLQARPRR